VKTYQPMATNSDFHGNKSQPFAYEKSETDITYSEGTSIIFKINGTKLKQSMILF
jgi:hypothetical protein